MEYAEQIIIEILGRPEEDDDDVVEQAVLLEGETIYQDLYQERF